jgi:adhesin/invasin
VVVIVSGQNQSAPINTKLTTDLSVAVTTQFGELVSGQTVTWVVVTGTGTLDPATSVTGDTGAASTSYTTGSASGTDKIQAKVGALPPVTFTVTVTP